MTGSRSDCDSSVGKMWANRGHDDSTVTEMVRKAP